MQTLLYRSSADQPLALDEFAVARQGKTTCWACCNDGQLRGFAQPGPRMNTSANEQYQPLRTYHIISHHIISGQIMYHTSYMIHHISYIIYDTFVLYHTRYHIKIILAMSLSYQSYRFSSYIYTRFFNKQLS